MINFVKVTIVGVSSNKKIGVVAVDLYLSRVPVAGETIKWSNKNCQIHSKVCDVEHIPYSSDNSENIAAIITLDF